MKLREPGHVGRPDHVPPGLTAGGGLKQAPPGDDGRTQIRVTPGLTAGGGLKQPYSSAGRGLGDVPPGLTAGGGLKPGVGDGRGERVATFPPASPPGAD